MLSCIVFFNMLCENIPLKSPEVRISPEEFTSKFDQEQVVTRGGPLDFSAGAGKPQLHPRFS